MPADHACFTITGTDEMKGNEMDEMSVEKLGFKFVVREKERNSDKAYPDPASSTTKPTWSARDVNLEPQRWEANF